MEDVVQPPLSSAKPATPSLRRRKPIATTLLLPTRLAVHSSTTTAGATSINTTTSASSSTSTSTSSVNLQFISIINPSSYYTSIRDLLPSPVAAIQSPTPSTPAGHSGYEISIRNRLVKQAAWAYLQPMTTSAESVAGTFIHRIWNKISVLFQFITRSFDRMLRSVRVRNSR